MQAVTSAAALVVFFMVASRALSAPCGAPDLSTAYPPDGASGVPVNANFRAEYAATAQSSGASVALERVGGATQTLPAQFDAAESTLEVDAPGLVAGASYVLTWPGLEGTGTTDVGPAESVSFTAGAGDDTASPSFSGLATVAWDVDREHDDCTDDIEQRYIFDLTPGRASDDFPVNLLAIRIFQTQGAGLAKGAPPVPLLRTHFPTTGTVRVTLALSDATGPMCFSADVEDLAGHESGGSDKEVCVTTTAPPFFYGCSVGTPPRNRGPSTASLLGLLGLSIFVRRRIARTS